MKKYLFWMLLGVLVGGAYGFFGGVFGLLGGLMVAAANPFVWRREYEEALKKRESQMAQQMPSVSVVPAEPKPLVADVVPEPAPTLAEQQAPVAPASVPKPSSRISRWLVRFFTEGNVVAKVGMILVFLGVAFLLKLAADYGQFPVYLRLLGVGCGSLALMGLGLRLRLQRPLYALILQGGGIGIFYTNTFAAYRVYHLIPASFAFVTLILAIVFATFLAIQQKAKSLAVLATLCGYLAPILISTGSHNHVALFSYYLLLNLSVFVVAWFQTWRLLHILGFAFTFGVGGIWGAEYYRPELFASVEPFLIANFLCYFVISILYAVKKSEQRQAIVDGTLVFGTPLIAFLMQYALVKNMAYGVFASAFALGGLYLFATKWLWKKYSESLRFFTETFLILGGIFVTLSVAFLLDRPTLAIFYAIEGAGLIFVGLRQRRMWAYLSGSFLLLFVSFIYYGIFAFSQGDNQAYRAEQGWLSPLLLSQIVILICAFFTSRQFFKNKETAGFTAQFFAYVHLAYAGLFWLYFGMNNADYYFSANNFELMAFVGFLAISLLVFDFLRTRLRWPEIQALCGLYPWLILVVYILAFPGNLLGEDLKSLVWLPFLAAQYFYLWRSDTPTLTWYKKINHFLTAWLTLLVTSGVLCEQFGRVLPWDAFYLMTFFWYAVVFMLAVVVPVVFGKPRWPFLQHKSFYTKGVLASILLVFWTIFFVMQFNYDGETKPIAYLPFLNPHDLNVIFFILAILAYRWFCRRDGLQMRSLKLRWFASRAFYFTIFTWLSFVLIRSLYQWTHDFDYNSHGIYTSRLVQTSLSIFWSFCALVVMVYATRKRLRYSWLVGAGLLAVVVLKLLFVDLSRVGSVARVISFLGSGGLFVLIGYLSPIPPSGENQERFV